MRRNLDEELRQFLEEPVDVLSLIKQLDFSEEEVEHAAMEQPGLFLEAARIRVQKMRKRAQAKMAFEAESARTRLHIAGTVQHKKDKSILVKSVRIAERRYEAALREEEFAKALMEAFRERKDATKIIVDARWAEAGNAVRRAKEQEGRNLARKVQKEVRRRYQELPEEDDDG